MNTHFPLLQLKHHCVKEMERECEKPTNHTERERGNQGSSWTGQGPGRTRRNQTQRCPSLKTWSRGEKKAVAAFGAAEPGEERPGAGRELKCPG